jgi:hypothetical protein
LRAGRASFQHAIGDGELAGIGKLRAVFLHAVANAPAPGLDRTAQRLDIARACAMQRTGFGERKYRAENYGRNDKTMFEGQGVGSDWLRGILTTTI